MVYDETIGSVAYQALLTTICDARNICASPKYDQLNRVYEVTYTDSRMPTLNNYYDQAHTGYFNKGKLTEVKTASVADNTGTAWDDSIPETHLKYDFDLMGRTVKSSQTVGSYVHAFEYTYNLGGQMTQEKYPSGRVVNLGYDGAGRLSNLNSGAGHVYVDAVTYAGHGGVTGLTLGNGATISLGYGTNGRLQLSDITLAKNGTTLLKNEYKYGVVESGSVNTAKNTSQLAQTESWIGTEQQYRQQYQYDVLGRVKESKETYGTSLGSTAYHVKYGYDVFGNRYQKASENSGNTTIPQKWVEAGDYDLDTNRFLTGVSYDAAGNITADPRFRNLLYGYDANGRQNYTAQANGTLPTTAIFDGAGQRVAEKAGGALSIMVYDAGGKLAAEYAQLTAPTTANIQYVTNNYQGSTSVVTNNSGGVVSRHDYLPFGEELGAGVGSRTTAKSFSQYDNVRQKYAGMETDTATGLNHTLWRKDDNLSGRWTSPDPYGGSMTTSDPQSFNRYTYCDNDPVNKTDALGLMSGADASQSWGDVAGVFWPSTDFNGNHFGGPGVVANGENGFPDRDHEEIVDNPSGPTDSPVTPPSSPYPETAPGSANAFASGGTDNPTPKKKSPSKKKGQEKPKSGGDGGAAGAAPPPPAAPDSTPSRCENPSVPAVPNIRGGVKNFPLPQRGPNVPRPPVTGQPPPVQFPPSALPPPPPGQEWIPDKYGRLTPHLRPIEGFERSNLRWWQRVILGIGRTVEGIKGGVVPIFVIPKELLIPEANRRPGNPT